MRPLLHQKLQNGTGEVRDRVDVLMFEFAQEHGGGIAVQQIEEFTLAGEAIMKNAPGSVGTGANAPGVDGGPPSSSSISSAARTRLAHLSMAGTRDVNSTPNPAHSPHMAKKGTQHAHWPLQTQISHKRANSVSQPREILRKRKQSRITVRQSQLNLTRIPKRNS